MTDDDDDDDSSSTKHTDMLLWSCVWCKHDDGGIQ